MSSCGVIFSRSSTCDIGQPKAPRRIRPDRIRRFAVSAIPSGIHTSKNPPLFSTAVLAIASLTKTSTYLPTAALASLDILVESLAKNSCRSLVSKSRGIVFSGCCSSSSASFSPASAAVALLRLPPPPARLVGASSSPSSSSRSSSVDMNTLELDGDPRGRVLPALALPPRPREPAAAVVRFGGIPGCLSCVCGVCVKASMTCPCLSCKCTRCQCRCVSSLSRPCKVQTRLNSAGGAIARGTR